MTVRELVLSKLQGGERPIQVLQELTAEVAILVASCPFDDIRRTLADDIITLITVATGRSGSDGHNTMN